MDMTQDFADANFMITSYEEDHVQINQEIYHQSVIISSDRLIHPWNVTDASQLNESTIAPILEIRPEILILGTGKSLVLPDPRIIALFAQQSIGFESMNTSAACRTYGVLIAEGRKAAAGLIFA